MQAFSLYRIDFFGLFAE